jgi:hypothetical protein
MSLPEYLNVFSPNAYALWTTAAVATKLVLVHQCGRCWNNLLELSEYLKHFKVLQEDVFAPLEEVFYLKYEEEWLKKELGEQLGWRMSELDDPPNAELMGKIRVTPEKELWEIMKNKRRESASRPNGPLNPFNHFSRCLVKMTKLMFDACRARDLSEGTKKKIQHWNEYFIHPITSKMPDLFSHFTPPIRRLLINLCTGLDRELQRQDEPNGVGDDFPFFSPGTLMIRAISNVYIGQLQSKHPQFEEWADYSSLIIFELIMKVQDPLLLLTDPTVTEKNIDYPFIQKLPLCLLDDPDIMEKTNENMENILEVVNEYFRTMISNNLGHQPDTRAEYTSLQNSLANSILRHDGVFDRSDANTHLRKEKNAIRSKTCRSTKKKVDQNRVRPHRPPCPSSPLEDNLHIFGKSIVDKIIEAIPYEKCSSPNKRQTSSPSRWSYKVSGLPKECN